MSNAAAVPHWVRGILAIDRVLHRFHVTPVRLTEDALTMAACRATGLSDFGDAHYRQGLLRLLDAIHEENSLHLIGRLALRDLITNSLVNRLLLMNARTQTPALFGRPIMPPIIILGLPRSGTTLLHRLLAADPAHRAIPLWELMAPLPSVTTQRKGRDQRRHLAEQRLARQLALAPDLDRKHYVRADTPEECMWLLAPSFVSVVFWVVAPVYGYLNWYRTHDRIRAYQEYAWWLQVLQGVNPARRLVLKAPAHLGSLAALRQAVPNALLIQTHRDPVTVCHSLNSLMTSVHGIVTERSDPVRMAEANVALLEHEVARNLAARADDSTGIMDVQYADLVADPIGTVRRIYAHFGLMWSDAYAETLQAYVRDHPQGKYGSHRYGRADGMRDAALAERFAVYTQRFGVTA